MSGRLHARRGQPRYGATGYDSRGTRTFVRWMVAIIVGGLLVAVLAATPETLWAL